MTAESILREDSFLLVQDTVASIDLMLGVASFLEYDINQFS